jgi:hypothetical protein
MKGKLRFDLEIKAHPYPKDPGANLEAWGCITMRILIGGTSVVLFDGEWDLAQLAEWYTESRTALCTEILAIEGNGSLPGESLLHALKRLQDHVFPLDDREAEAHWDDALYEYRQRHSLWAALPGAQVPDMVIGCNHGSGEVAISDKGIEQVYQFDIDDICQDLKQQLLEFLIEWSSTTQDGEARTRAARLIGLLQESTQKACCN